MSERWMGGSAYLQPGLVLHCIIYLLSSTEVRAGVIGSVPARAFAQGVNACTYNNVANLYVERHPC